VNDILPLTPNSFFPDFFDILVSLFELFQKEVDFLAFHIGRFFPVAVLVTELVFLEGHLERLGTAFVDVAFESCVVGDRVPRLVVVVQFQSVRKQTLQSRLPQQKFLPENLQIGLCVRFWVQVVLEKLIKNCLLSFGKSS
jgi:hypothetical protein